MTICNGVLVALAIFVWSISFVSAQSLSGIHIGDNIRVTARIGSSPVANSRSGPFTMMKWGLEDGNDLSITAIDGGTIVYLESDWGGRQGGSYTDFPGFYYGRTTLAEIRQKLGSNGFVFGDRTVKLAPDGSILTFNSYEISGNDNTDVTFINKISKSEAKIIKYHPNEFASSAKLVSVILGYPECLRNIWGSQLVFDPAYQKIQWQ